VARQLRAATFINILDQASQEILNLLKLLERESRPDEDGQTSRGEAGATAQIGSISLSGGDPPSPTSTSRKRKRSEAVGDVNQMLVVVTQHSHWQTDIASSFLQTLRFIVGGADALGGEEAEEKDMYVQEHMKSVIRSEPATAARIFGNILTVVSIVCNSNRLRQEELHFAALTSCVEVWESRSHPSDDQGGEAINVRHYLNSCRMSLTSASLSLLRAACFLFYV
jgi:hypothetical protein